MDADQKREYGRLGFWVAFVASEVDKAGSCDIITLERSVRRGPPAVGVNKHVGGLEACRHRLRNDILNFFVWINDAISADWDGNVMGHLS